MYCNRNYICFSTHTINLNLERPMKKPKILRFRLALGLVPGRSRRRGVAIITVLAIISLMTAANSSKPIRQKTRRACRCRYLTPTRHAARRRALPQHLRVHLLL